jgi:hypothetical protein
MKTTENSKPIGNGLHEVAVAVDFDGERTMWRERAEAAEAEVRMLSAMIPPHEVVEAVEIHSLATRLVALAAMYPGASVNRAICMLRDEANRHGADDEDSAALHNIIRVLERRSDPVAWHAEIERSHAILGIPALDIPDHVHEVGSCSVCDKAARRR